jgi:hypothetical protein
MHTVKLVCQELGLRSWHPFASAVFKTRFFSLVDPACQESHELCSIETAAIQGAIAIVPSSLLAFSCAINLYELPSYVRCLQGRKLSHYAFMHTNIPPVTIRL